jgi:hypothetical protein
MPRQAKEKIEEVVEVAETVTLENEVIVNPKVLDYVGLKGVMEFLDTNLAGSARIMVDLYNPQGGKIEALCSPAVSAELRTKRRTKDSLLFLDLVLNENGRYVIQRERGKKIRVLVESLNTKRAPQTVATFEEAIGY